MSFWFRIENEEDYRMSFLDVEIICDSGKFTWFTTVYRRPILEKFVLYDRFLPSICKRGMTHILLYRWFSICSDLKISFRIDLMVRLRRAVILVTLSVIALKRNLITNIERRKKVITVPKKPLFPILPYLGLLSLQTGTILRKSLKGIVNCPKLLIIYQS